MSHLLIQILARPLYAFAAVLLLCVFLPSPALAQLDPFEKVHEKKGPINITAGQVEYDKANKIVTATGQAKATQQDFSISADKLIYYDEEKRLEAVGNVVMQEWENLYKADRMVIDTENETGVLINGEVYLAAGNFQLCGDRVEKLPADRYHIEDGLYTTCTCPPGEKPSWTFQGTTMDVTYGNYGAVSNARLKAKGIPIIYFPKLAFPAPRERRSGFLFPDLYWTSRKGFSTSVPFYWAIAQNADATLVPRFIERRGAGADLEVRYIRTRQSKGEGRFSYFNEFRFKRVAPLDPERSQWRKLGDKDPAPSVAAFKPDASLHRWELSAGYGEQWTPTLGSGASIHILSDELYYELASRKFDTAKPFTMSTVTTSKGWRGTGLTATVRYFQDLVPTQPPLCQPAGSDSNATSVGVDRAHGTCNRIWVVERPITYQQFPKVQFGTSLYDPDQAPLALSLNSEVTRFYRFPGEPIPEHLIDQVATPPQAYRMILTPGTGLPYDLWGYFNGSVRLEMDQLVYYVPDYETGTTQNFAILRPTVETRTSLIRRYRFPFGPIRRIIHQVQPTIRYTLINPVSLPSRRALTPADATLLEPPPPGPIPPEPGGPGPGLHSFGIFSFDGRDGGTKQELIELVLRNQFPTTYVTWGGREGGIDPFELLLTQPISVNELKREDMRKSAVAGGYESHYKYNQNGFVRQRQAEQMELVVVPKEPPKAPPRQEVDDIVSTKDEHRPLLPLVAEIRSKAIRNLDIQIKATVDPYYGREFQSLTAFLGVIGRFRFRSLGMKYTFGAKSLKPQNAPDPDSANRDNPFYVHSQYIEPRARFYLHPRFVIGGDASYDLGIKRPYFRGGVFGVGEDKTKTPQGKPRVHRTGLPFASGVMEYYSACRCWSAFVMTGRRLVGRREDYTLQAEVNAFGEGISDDDWIFQFGINLEGLIGVGQRPDF